MQVFELRERRRTPPDMVALDRGPLALQRNACVRSHALEGFLVHPSVLIAGF
jgi:hypothetical protein